MEQSCRADSATAFSDSHIGIEVNLKRLAVVGFGLGIVLLTVPAVSAAGPAACDGDPGCLADRAIATIRAAKDLHIGEPTSTLFSASTVEAALGRWDAAKAGLPDITPSTTGYNPAVPIRARALGRLALAMGADHGPDGNAEINDATDLLSHMTANGAFVYEQAVADIAADLFLLGQDEKAVALLESPPHEFLGFFEKARFASESAPFFLAASLGRLAGISYQLARDQEGDRLIQRAREETRRLVNETHHSLALQGIALGQFEGGHLEDALVTARSITKTSQPAIGFAMNAAEGRARVLTHIAAVEAVQGNYSVALSVVQENGHDYLNPVVRFIVLDMANKGFPGSSRVLLDQIRSWVDGIAPGKVEPTFLAALGSAYIQSGDRNTGEAYINTTIAAALHPRSNAGLYGHYDFHDFYIAAAARAYAEAGEYDRALKLIADNLPRASAARNLARWGAVKNIAICALRRGQFDDAMKIAESENEQTLHDAVMHAWATMEADSGRYVDAEHRADGIESDEERAQAYVDVAARAVSSRSDRARHIVVFRDEYEHYSLFDELLAR